jgi:hypothetical protein
MSKIFFITGSLSRCCGEVALKDALSDPIVQAVMAADDIDPQEFEAALTRIGRLRQRQSGDHRPQAE